MDVLVLGGPQGIPPELAESLASRGHRTVHHPELRAGLKEYSRTAPPCVVLLPDVLEPATFSSIHALNIGSPSFLLALVTGGHPLLPDELLRLGAHDVAWLPCSAAVISTRLAVAEARLAEWTGKRPPSTSEGWVRIIFNAMREGVLLQTREGVIHACNPAAERVLGLTQDQMRGLRSIDPGWKAMHEDGRPMQLEERPGFRAIQSGQPAGNVMGVQQGGQPVRWINVTSIPLFRPSDERPYAVVSSFVDISDRVQAQQAARRAQEDLLRIFRGSPDAMVLLREGRVAQANPAFLEAMGLGDIEAAVGRRFVEMADAADRARLEQHLNDPHAELAEFRFPRAHAAPVLVELAAPHGIDLDEGPATLLMGRDVTERHELQSRLLLADRLASVGTLAAGVAHEINNPLSYVLGNLYSMQEQLDDALVVTPELGDWRANMKEMLRDALHGSDRVRRIVGQMRMFARGEDERREPVDVRVALEMSLKMSENQIRPRARLTTQLGSVPAVMANEAHLVQVFLNLLINAVHALPDDAPEQQEIIVSLGMSPDGRVAAAIRDTGIGIAPENLGRIFDPFFTTKPVGAGTGLGLSVAHTLVAGMGGEIRVQSVPGRGTTFTVLLPPSGMAALPAVYTPPPTELPTQRGRVLVVDDDELVRKMLVRMLQRDHDVSSAQGVAEALGIVRSRPIDVVICDIMMDRLGGADFYDMLQSELPAMLPRIVFLTGGAFTSRARELLERAPNPRLHKPVQTSRLRSVVLDVLTRLGRVDGDKP